MSAATAAPTTAAPAPKPAAPKAAPKEAAPLDPATLVQNAEGYVVVDPNAEPAGAGTRAADPITIVNARLVLGYGGPIAVQSERGLFKALGGDAIYDLSDGNRYVLPKELAEALGNTLPEPTVEELLLVTGAVDPGDERLTGEALDNAILAKAANEGREAPTTLSYRDKVFYTLGQKSTEERKVATQHAPAPPQPPK